MARTCLNLLGKWNWWLNPAVRWVFNFKPTSRSTCGWSNSDSEDSRYRFSTLYIIIFIREWLLYHFTVPVWFVAHCFAGKEDTEVMTLPPQICKIPLWPFGQPENLSCDRRWSTCAPGVFFPMLSPWRPGWICYVSWFLRFLRCSVWNRRSCFLFHCPICLFISHIVILGARSSTFFASWEMRTSSVCESIWLGLFYIRQ